MKTTTSTLPSVRLLLATLCFYAGWFLCFLSLYSLAVYCVDTVPHGVSFWLLGAPLGYLLARAGRQLGKPTGRFS